MTVTSPNLFTFFNVGYLGVVLIMSARCSASVQFLFTFAHNFSPLHCTCPQSQVLLFIHINNRFFTRFNAMLNVGLPTKPIRTRSKTRTPTSSIVLEVDSSAFPSDNPSGLLAPVSVCGDYSLLMYLSL